MIRTKVADDDDDVIYRTSDAFFNRFPVESTLRSSALQVGLQTLPGKPAERLCEWCHDVDQVSKC